MKGEVIAPLFFSAVGKAVLADVHLACKVYPVCLHYLFGMFLLQ